MAQQSLADVRKQLFSSQQASMQQDVWLPALRHTFPRNGAIRKHIALDDHRLRTSGSHGRSSEQAGEARANDHYFHSHRKSL